MTYKTKRVTNSTIEITIKVQNQIRKIDYVIRRKETYCKMKFDISLSDTHTLEQICCISNMYFIHFIYSGNFRKFLYFHVLQLIFIYCCSFHLSLNLRLLAFIFLFCGWLYLETTANVWILLSKYEAFP